MRKSFFLCTECGYKTAKWMGRCPQCGQWNTLIEVNEDSELEATTNEHSILGIPNAKPTAITEIDFTRLQRENVEIDEFDRCLGGIVPGQAILISGEPGIGKSTLLLQIASQLSRKHKVYYVNSEESNSQVKVRAQRMKIDSPNLFLLSENNVDRLITRVQKDKPDILLVDSVQTIFCPRYNSLPGSIVQVRESAYKLVSFAKHSGIPLFLVSHITKTGNIAGPKVLEHIVDTVLFLETDSHKYYRILRSLKNRFAPTDEIGFFTMEENGLNGIEDLSTAFTSIHEKEVNGVSLFLYMDGNRVFPVEVQALCIPSHFNYPRRATDGMDVNRLYMLLAIMEKRLSLKFSGLEVFVNITGGLKIDDPALDLPVIFALYSSIKNKPAQFKTAVIGEVGLSGEVRPVYGMEKRIEEAQRLGFDNIIVPYNKKHLKASESLTVLPIKNIEEGIALI